MEEVAQERAEAGWAGSLYKGGELHPAGQAADGLSGGTQMQLSRPCSNGQAAQGPQGSRPLTGWGEDQVPESSLGGPQHSGRGCTSPARAAGAAVYDTTATSPGRLVPTEHTADRRGSRGRAGRGRGGGFSRLPWELLQTHRAWGGAKVPAQEQGQQEHLAFRLHGGLGEAMGVSTSAGAMPGNAGCQLRPVSLGAGLSLVLVPGHAARTLPCSQEGPRGPILTLELEHPSALSPPVLTRKLLARDSLLPLFLAGMPWGVTSDQGTPLRGQSRSWGLPW